MGIRDRTAWLLPAFLLLGVLAPTGAVLWFMNEAARTQAEASRQNVREAYRGQLRLLRDRLEQFWKARAAALEEAWADGAPSAFPKTLQVGGADSAILLAASGAARYPSFPRVREAESRDGHGGWTAAESLESARSSQAQAAAAYGELAAEEKDPSWAARAAQGRVRTLLRTNRAAALNAIQTYFHAGRLVRGLDPEGRLIAADEQLLAIQLLPPSDRRRTAWASSLARLLNDYDAAPPMPSAQRLFLMTELRAAVKETPPLPTYPAEQLAAQALEAEGARPGGAALEATAVSGVWKLTSPRRRVIALYRAATVVEAAQRLFAEGRPSPSVRFTLVPPGAAAGDAIAAGAPLPGWQIAFTLLNSKPFEEAARGRLAGYLWVGYLAVAGVALVGVALGQSFRRQLRLTRLKTDLVAAVSHELKTPLASMRLLVDSLLEDGVRDAVKTREYLELISGENRRLARLIDNFLAFSRIERNRQRFEFAPTNPAEVVKAALASLKERLAAPGCTVEVDVVPELPLLQADADALATSLINLLDNAWKYTPAQKRIGVRAYQEDGHVAFAVKDNGIGISPRDRKRIFRRFYQVDRRLARESGGCGLGLSIVEFIAQAHGGVVRVQSRPGEGSVFTLSIPAGVRA
jgi:signal transduction histidine kinase